MSAATIARPYAKAAFEYALEHKLIDTWLTLLQNAASLVNNADLRAFLINPKVSSPQAAEMMISLYGDDLPAGSKNFFKLLAQKKRLLVLPEISEIFVGYVATQLQAIEVSVVSAHTLTAAQEQTLQQSLTKHFDKTVKMTTSVDEELLGGVIIHADDLVIDGSVRGRLKQLYKKLVVG